MNGGFLLRPFRRSDERLRSIGSEPDYRFSLANERTFLAYLRTALAFFAAGAAVLAVVDVFDSPTLDAVLGAALIALGVLSSATSYGRWRRNEEAMRRSAPLPFSPVPRLLASGLTVVALVTAVVAVLR